MDFDEIFASIAKEKGTTALEIKNEIEEIAREGLKSEKIKERYFWHQVPKKGEFPTAEEIVTFLSLVAYQSGETVEMNNE